MGARYGDDAKTKGAGKELRMLNDAARSRFRVVRVRFLPPLIAGDAAQQEGDGREK